jgi:hypothetical protein
MQRSRIALEEIELTEEGDRRIRVVRARIANVRSKFQDRVAGLAESMAEWAEIDELKNIA